MFQNLITNGFVVNVICLIYPHVVDFLLYNRIGYDFIPKSTSKVQMDMFNSTN